MDRYTMRKRIIATSLNKKRFLSGVFLTLLATVVNAQPFPYQQAGLPVSQRVDDLMKRMTLEEKIAQIRHLHSWDIFNEQTLDKEKLTAVVGETGYGFVEGFPLTGENCRSSMREIQEYMLPRPRLGIPAFTVAESLHGSAHEGSTIFPQNIALGSTFNPALAYRRACMTADDLHAQGMRQVLAPCIDVVRDLRWGRVEESYGEDPYLCGIFAQSEVKGYLDSGISPMLKHYGPHGNPLGGLNLASVDCGLYDLHAVYLKPFEMVLRHLPVYAVMSTYNSWNRIPNSASRYLLTDILRDRWGFKGYVYSDWGAIEMLETFHHTAANKAEAAIQALTAGLDVEASSECYPELFRLVKEGKLDKSYIDTAVRRVLTAKFECGLFEDPYGDKHAASGGMHSLRSVELSRQIAEESIVLLKNENNLLPLDMNKLTSIAVLGPNADQVQFGDYTWSRDNKDGITPLQGIKALVGEKIKINHAVGCSMMSRDTTGIGEAVEATLKSDVAVIFCGCSSASLARDYTRTNCGEGFDLSDLSLTGAQSDLIQAVYATGKPVILVLVSGKPFAISWEKEHIPAIVAQWYGGEQEGYAIADVLFGKVNPSGHLTYSFPQSAGHLPVYYNHLPSDKGFYKRPGSYEQSGRDYVFSSPEPLWAFGHGLSYTTFSFDKMECDKNIYASGDTIEVKVQVRNTGQRTGKEVVQLYVRDLVSSVVTPVKQLKAFAKLELKPGEQKEVILKVPVSELYLIDKEGIPFLEPGEFEIQVGNASDCILQKQVIGVGDISVTAVSVSSMKQNQVKTGTGKKITMRGVVRDVQATPVEGVHIYSMGNKTELAVTNKKGEYLLKQVASDDILIFSKEGYVSKEMSVEGRSVLNVRL